MIAAESRGLLGVWKEKVQKLGGMGPELLLASWSDL